MPRTIPAILLLLSSLAPAQGDGSYPGTWSQWRGPDRNGHCAGAPWPKELSEDNFKLQWRTKLAPSYSGPVVDETRVFTTETVNKSHEVVKAYDRDTGKELWQTKWKGSMRVPFFAAKNGSWIRSTPAFDGESLFVAGMRDVLACIDGKTGEVRWTVDFMERFKTPLPQFGFVCSPLVTGDSVYVQAGASFVRLNKKTGETVWRTLEDAGGMFGAAFSSPVLCSLRGEEQLVVQTRESLNGIGKDDGEVLWTQPVRSFRGMNILTPQPYGDAVFTSAYGGRAHLFQISNEGDEFSVKEEWTNRAQGNMTSPVIINDHAYLYLRSKRFSCVDLKAGTVAWISEPQGDEYWSLVAQGDRMLALSNDGELRLIKANPEKLEVLGKVRVSDSATWAHLAVDGDQVLIREQDGLSAFRWRESP